MRKLSTTNREVLGRTRQVKQQIVQMTLNGSGVRDIARVLQVSTSTVIQGLKKTGSAQVSQLTAEMDLACD